MQKRPRAPRALTIEQLSKRSGFDRRTIAYYTTMGLLPKVGRRGPRTTYPPSVLDRLLVVAHVRRLQQDGRLTDVTLRDMAQVLGQLREEEIAELARGGASPERLEAAFTGGGATRMSLSAKPMVRESDSWSDEPSGIEQELTQLLLEVGERAKGRPPGETAGETLYRVPITDDVLLTVRNIDKNDATLVERMAALLRRLTKRPGS